MKLFKTTKEQKSFAPEQASGSVNTLEDAVKRVDIANFTPDLMTVAYLMKVYPQRTADIKWSDREIWLKVGQNQLIDKLIHRLKKSSSVNTLDEAIKRVDIANFTPDLMTVVYLMEICPHDTPDINWSEREFWAHTGQHQLINKLIHRLQKNGSI
ncbi:hypothetical protein [Bartonella sp. DGB2]|uniref:hypothetical protein n=1 Tax=Bartonella sp. DGB2 TaxID=3388426 RepID=UPI00398FC504